MLYTVCVVHTMESKKMSRRDAEQFKAMTIARMNQPSVITKISETVQKYMPESLKSKVSDVIEQKQKEVVSSAELTSIGRDKYIVVVKNTVHASQQHTLEEAVEIKAALDKSLGKWRGKNSKLDIEVVESAEGLL